MTSTVCLFSSIRKMLDYEDIWDDPVYQDENLEENQDVKERRFGASISVLILITFPLNI